jgi:hypothetical protein
MPGPCSRVGCVALARQLGARLVECKPRRTVRLSACVKKPPEGGSFILRENPIS